MGAGLAAYCKRIKILLDLFSNKKSSSENPMRGGIGRRYNIVELSRNAREQERNSSIWHNYRSDMLTEYRDARKVQKMKERIRSRTSLFHLTRRAISDVS